MFWGLAQLTDQNQRAKPGNGLFQRNQAARALIYSESLPTDFEVFRDSLGWSVDRYAIQTSTTAFEMPILLHLYPLHTVTHRVTCY